MFEKTKKLCDSFLEVGLPGFDVIAYKSGKQILRYFGGYSDIENKIKINSNEKYNIYSCSKPITCTAALQLWEKGLFSLEDKLSDYMPEFSDMTVKTENGIKKSENQILIKNLFEMTSGLSYDLESESLMQFRKESGGRCPTREAMKYLAKEPLEFEVGGRWQYSIAHDVLAALVEVLSGEKFEDYVKKNIFDVLGMNNSTFMLPESGVENICAQYEFKDGRAVNIGKNIRYFKMGSEYASGGAGGISTVDDYIKFLEGLRKGILLKPETLRLMRTNRLNEAQMKTYWIRETHGYGLGVRCPGADEKYNDFGWDGAAGSFAAVDLENELTVFFATHLHLLPCLGPRSLLYRLIKAELSDSDDIQSIQKELKNLHNYDLTF